MPPRQLEHAKQEVMLLSQLAHPCIVEYRDSFIQDNNLNIVMEYCEKGDLGSLIKRTRERKQHLEEGQILDWFTQLASAVDYIHKRRVLHRDLKSQNVFLTGDDTVRLGDFGIARVLEHTFEQANTVIGTPYTMSPEVCANQPYSTKSDMWALGCVLYEMAALKHAFASNNLLAVVHAIANTPHAPIPAQYSPTLRSLVDTLLSKDPAARWAE